MAPRGNKEPDTGLHETAGTTPEGSEAVAPNVAGAEGLPPVTCRIRLLEHVMTGAS